ncbi:MAG: MFS transporter [Faecousia sp.]
MEQSMEKKYNYPTGVKYKVFQVAILSLSLLLASVSIGGMLLGDLAAEYPDAPVWLIQSFVTFPTIGNMIANIVGGASAAKIGKKNLCLVGIALATLGAFLPMFVPSLLGKIALRVAAGFGIGLIQPLSASLIIDCFEGMTANVMMGFQSSCVGLGASIFAYTMTAIMARDWHFAYCAHLYGVAIFVLVLFGVPAFVNDIGRDTPAAAETVTTKKTASKLPAACWLAFAAQLIFGLGFGCLDNCLSLAAVEVGISTVSAAAIASWGGMAALIGGLFFGVVKGKIGYNVGWVSLLLTIVGFLMVGFTDTVPMWYVAVTLLKVGFCWWMPYINFLANDGTDESNSALATSLGFFGNSFGAFIFAYVLAIVSNLIGGMTQHQAWFYGCVWLSIAFVLVAFNHFKNYKHYAELK